jgi:hypothetical protein
MQERPSVSITRGTIPHELKQFEIPPPTAGCAANLPEWVTLGLLTMCIRVTLPHHLCLLTSLAIVEEETRSRHIPPYGI